MVRRSRVRYQSKSSPAISGQARECMADQSRSEGTRANLYLQNLQAHLGKSRGRQGAHPAIQGVRPSACSLCPCQEFMNVVAAECTKQRHHPEWSNVSQVTEPEGVCERRVPYLRYPTVRYVLCVRVILTARWWIRSTTGRIFDGRRIDLWVFLEKIWIWRHSAILKLLVWVNSSFLLLLPPSRLRSIHQTPEIPLIPISIWRT